MISNLNPGFAQLAPYPFERLTRLLTDVTPDSRHAPIPLSIGEPRHAPPDIVLRQYERSLLEGVTRYPTMRGTRELRLACAGWLQRRFDVNADPDTMVHPVTGTREALFAIAQALVAPGTAQRVLFPNPFYQIYEGAALLAGAIPTYLPATAQYNFLPDLDAIEPDILDQTQLFYLCSPVNPCGTVASLDYLSQLVTLAKRHDFVIVADECYIELYRDAPPVSLLNACASLDDDAFSNVLAFHSLSKRSNLPGLRSGFVAGDPALIDYFARYRTYHGCSMSLAVQHASITAWNDDAHVHRNREQYNEKYAMAIDVLGDVLDVTLPPATFYLWPDVGCDDELFCQELYRDAHVTAVPGSYLARDVDGNNPGAARIRLSLVASFDDTHTALQRLAHFIRHRSK
ncbi:MAG: succinyldiaminopimelate transaminase [Pseudomonadota bacterium]